MRQWIKSVINTLKDELGLGTAPWPHPGRGVTSASASNCSPSAAAVWFNSVLDAQDKALYGRLFDH